ncbi:MAG TPA: CDP-2,3-bis-(O-geranylgeranyl)-sn-glycerol synthase [Candidatus Aenigmarchaeota archaeon]|nr:CDP-2,3-bis-(O-geranylgeranyl)-sn-glycerol synthase [Candidatus Aenigmarchaeota archaeon]
MVFDVYTLVEAVWLILPAYAANGLVPLVGIRKTHPIDFGKRFYDRKPILGSGKTWEGLVFGIFIAMLISTVEMLAYPFLPFDASPVPLSIVPMSPVLGFLLGAGAMMGDAAGSFIKRRLNLKRGASAPILDQDDFIVGALLFASFTVSVKSSWILLLLIITPIIHLTANFIGYKLKIKKQPW